VTVSRRAGRRRETVSPDPNERRIEIDYTDAVYCFDIDNVKADEEAARYVKVMDGYTRRKGRL